MLKGDHAQISLRYQVFQRVLLLTSEDSKVNVPGDGDGRVEFHDARRYFCEVALF